MEETLTQLFAFIKEIDKEKLIGRQTYLTDGMRKENDAEHSWHLALMAVLLKEYSNEEVSLEKVIPMVLIHDLVEIDAGDTYAYDGRPCGNQGDQRAEGCGKDFSDCFQRIREAGSGSFGKSLRHTRHRKQSLPTYLITVSRFF